MSGIAHSAVRGMDCNQAGEDRGWRPVQVKGVGALDRGCGLGAERSGQTPEVDFGSCWWIGCGG